MDVHVEGSCTKSVVGL